ncbi:unnamed protein product [Lactuca virosa]|uniref:Uncharacterized protein n=1 Tax=Lactuca virosa TaxID=75947 RepID=A0AAU9LQV7_9ASTR|nr:unnamed protein product [Lactuca virosa]
MKELVMFRKFAEVENTPAASSINVEVAEEHVGPVNEAVISPNETEKEINIFKQPNDPTPEQMGDLIEKLQSTARKPPQTVHVITEPPSESDQEDSAHVLLPRKRKRRDPRPKVLITDTVQNVSTPVEPSPMAQNIESTFIESSPVMQEISTPGLSSFEALELDILKGKSKLPKSEFVDVARLQNSVFDLEQSSAEKDLTIGEQDIRINTLEKENSVKDAKISELQANIGGLTSLFFDLKQRLHQMFGDDFQPLSAEGEKIYASSSGPVNPTPQPASERVIRPAPDENLDTFLSSGPAST